MRSEPPGIDLRDGTEWRAVSDKDWRTPSQYPYQCQHRGCGNEPVADMRRQHGKGTRWWAYCADHLYGRWIEDGVVYSWHVVES